MSGEIKIGYYKNKKMSKTYTVEGKSGFKFFTNGKIEQGFVLINQYGAIRFKKDLATDMGFVAGSRWLIGTNEEEEFPKFLYVLKANADNETDGYKMTFQNKSWSITCRNVLLALDVKYPAKCRMEHYKGDNYEGLRIILPQKTTTK